MIYHTPGRRESCARAVGKARVDFPCIGIALRPGHEWGIKPARATRYPPAMTATAPTGLEHDRRAVRRGIVLFCLGTFVWALLDTLSKHMTGEYHPVQITWGRQIFAVLILFVTIPRREVPGVFRALRPGLQVLRPVLAVTVSLSFVASVSVMPLADATAIAFTTPLFVTALAAVFLGERVGPRRWSAVVVGFIGVVIVARPGANGVQAVTLLVLALAFVNAVFQIITRFISAIDSPHTTMLYTIIIAAILTSVLAPFFWTTPDLLGWVELVAQGVLTGLGHYIVIQAIRDANVSTLAPFTYFQIIWAAGLGLFVFGDVPAWTTIVGAAVIVASGVYMFYREAYVRAHPRA